MARKNSASALEIYIDNYQISSLGDFTRLFDSCRVASRLSLAFVAHSSSEFGQCARQGHKKTSGGKEKRDKKEQSAATGNGAGREQGPRTLTHILLRLCSCKRQTQSRQPIKWWWSHRPRFDSQRVGILARSSVVVARCKSMLVKADLYPDPWRNFLLLFIYYTFICRPIKRRLLLENTFLKRHPANPNWTELTKQPSSQPHSMRKRIRQLCRLVCEFWLSGFCLSVSVWLTNHKRYKWVKPTKKRC